MSLFVCRLKRGEAPLVSVEPVTSTHKKLNQKAAKCIFSAILFAIYITTSGSKRAGRVTPGWLKCNGYGRNPLEAVVAQLVEQGVL